MRAISALSRDAGMSTRVCLAITALRIRVSMSAIGSVIFSSSPIHRFIPRRARDALSAVEGSPTALRHARDVAFERELAETEATERELAHVGARAAAQAAAVAQPDLELRALGFLRDLRCRGH